MTKAHPLLSLYLRAAYFLPEPEDADEIAAILVRNGVNVDDHHKAGMLPIEIARAYNEWRPIYREKDIERIVVP